jgi:two-component system, LuxR family, sensor kinase FixL
MAERHPALPGGGARQGLALVLALGFASLGFVARLALTPVLSEGDIFLFFVPAVVLASAYGGLGPGVAATLLGIAGGALVSLRLGPLGLGDLTSAAVFGAVCGAIVTGGEWFQRSRREAIAINRDLARSEAHLKSILDTVPDAMIVIDEAGIMRSVSSAAERLFGWTATEAVGRNVSVLMPAPHREAHDGYMQRYYDTGERRIIGVGRVVEGARKDGSTFPMELSVGEVRTERGRFFTGFARDLSERRTAEARMQELQAELVHVSRLTAMGEMASALAHELNQPLAAISNYLRGSSRLLARPEADAPRVREALEKAAAQALRAGEIIRRLREFAARGETERRVETLRAIVEEASALALVGAQEQGVRVAFQYDPDTPDVLADRVQIQQVVLNLIRNAMDAMDVSPRRELAVTVEPVEAGFARVSVSDTGPGVDPEVAAQLFTPFITTKRHGMGVGLSISRTIVEAHGGRIWTEPTPGGGATFRFTLRTAEEFADG